MGEKSLRQQNPKDHRKISSVLPILLWDDCGRALGSGVLVFKPFWNAWGSDQPKDINLPCVDDLRLSDRPGPRDLWAWISLKDSKFWCPSAWVHTAMSLMPLAPAETVSGRTLAKGKQVPWGKHCQARGSSKLWIPCCCWLSAWRSEGLQLKGSRPDPAKTN